ncbi:uncharacterized protein LOC124942803 [Impatiens glandulifera]|uniref:uncharacterized protein LOC124942803 n=1 Tax=Impatiens glandulifera TaxID=253017 RepID=UPI001FB0BD0C|nr:uncharacterized protein LOC124942803 [Impatiens glandulifera]
MSIDFYTESPPRISFSSDLLPNNNQTQITNQTDLTDFTFHSQPTNDFHFTFSSSSTSINEPSPADELFSGGLIKPLNSKTHSKKSIETENPETDQPIKPTTTTNKSIWGIKRSSSLHCEESIHKKNSSSFWSLPLLARSNSTGSVSVSVQKNGSKENQNHSQKQQKQIRNSSSSSSSSSSTNSSFSMYNFSQKPPLKKNYGNGIRIVNVPSSFGFSSLFRTSSNNGKERKNKK